MIRLISILLLATCSFAQDLWTQPSATMLRSFSENPNCHIWQAGRSAGGRPIWQVIVIRPETQPSHALRVMIVGGIHGNEPKAPRQTLEILQNFAQNPPAGICYIFVPLANPDGLMGSKRTNSHGADLNRDFGAFTQPESRAIAAVYAQWRPHLYVDIHDWGPDFPHSGSGIEVGDSAACGPLWPTLQGVSPNTSVAERGYDARLSHRYFAAAYRAPSVLLETGKNSQSYAKEMMLNLQTALAPKATGLAAALNRRLNLAGWSASALATRPISAAEIAYPSDFVGTVLLICGYLLLAAGFAAWWRLRHPPLEPAELRRKDLLQAQLVRMVSEHHHSEAPKKKKAKFFDRRAA